MAAVDSSPEDKLRGAITASVAMNNPNTPSLKPLYGSDQYKLKLYVESRSPASLNCITTLYEKKFPEEKMIIAQRDQLPKDQQLRLPGPLPMLVASILPGDGSKIKEEHLHGSSIICEYFNEEFSDEKIYGPDLLPETAIADARKTVYDNIHTLLKQFDPKGTWILDDKFSMVDVTLASWSIAIWECYCHRRVPPNREFEAEWDRWLKWNEAIQARESWDKAWRQNDGYYRIKTWNISE
ncbi:hypothetical protein F4810DRAFT_715082 [Camillea tinctor]|nr:hypothetical protein F4810DRAFT_715082 [Camillea tinctor]